jgi:hypothetical protein
VSKPKPVPTVRVIKVAYALKHAKLRVALTTVDPRRQRLAKASIRLALKRNGRWFGAVNVRTAANGVGVFTRPTKIGCYSANVVRVKASGFTWNGVTPKNAFCVRTSARARSA